EHEADEGGQVVGDVDAELTQSEVDEEELDQEGSIADDLHVPGRGAPEPRDSGQPTHRAGGADEETQEEGEEREVDCQERALEERGELLEHKAELEDVAGHGTSGLSGGVVGTGPPGAASHSGRPVRGPTY